MIETVARAGLAVNESITVKKNRISNLNCKQPTGKRVCIVTGIHGDELEGQLVCAKTAERLQKNISLLNGVVDIYPALNPLGIDRLTRGIPLFDLDMNRIFPGSSEGTMAECLAAGGIETYGNIIGVLLAKDLVESIAEPENGRCVESARCNARRAQQRIICSVNKCVGIKQKQLLLFHDSVIVSFF